MKPALLVIDVQKAFFNINAQTTQALNEAVEYINPAIALFREKGLPIVVIRHMDEKDNLLPGVEGFDNPESLHVLPTDLAFHKTYENGFNKTGLYEKLHELGVDTVIISGFCAEYCVLSTYRGSEDYDLTPIILRGAIASGNTDRIKFVENICDIISYRALEKVLE